MGANPNASVRGPLISHQKGQTQGQQALALNSLAWISGSSALWGRCFARWLTEMVHYQLWKETLGALIGTAQSAPLGMPSGHGSLVLMQHMGIIQSRAHLTGLRGKVAILCLGPGPGGP